MMVQRWPLKSLKEKMKMRINSSGRKIATKSIKNTIEKNIYMIATKKI